MSTIEIVLKYPVAQPDGKPPVERLLFKGRLKIKHLLSALGSDDVRDIGESMTFPQVLKMLAAWAEVPVEIMHEMDLAEDVPKLMEKLGPFLPGSH
jgi:hypothetical protein